MRGYLNPGTKCGCSRLHISGQISNAFQEITVVAKSVSDIVVSIMCLTTVELPAPDIL